MFKEFKYLGSLMRYSNNVKAERKKFLFSGYLDSALCQGRHEYSTMVRALVTLGLRNMDNDAET